MQRKKVTAARSSGEEEVRGGRLAFSPTRKAGCNFWVRTAESKG